MTMPGRHILLLFAAVLLVVGAASTSTADDDQFKVIVNPDNPSASVSRDFLRDAFLKKEGEWNGETLRPIDLSSKYVARDQFTKDVIRKSPSQLRTYWNQQVFSGKGVPPPEVDSVTDVVGYVLANPGAVGYLPADADPGRAKVIPIR
jgi:ABC-type phosphate transport system substrate-binding protein